MSNCLLCWLLHQAARPYRRELVYLLAGLAVILRLLPAIAPSKPPTGAQLISAGLAVVLLLLAAAPVINYYSNAISSLGATSSGLWVVASVGLLERLAAVRRKGKNYLSRA